MKVRIQIQRVYDIDIPGNDPQAATVQAWSMQPFDVERRGDGIGARIERVMPHTTLDRLRDDDLRDTITEVHNLTSVDVGFPWTHKSRWGVTDAAWAAIEKAKIHPLLVFCHPRVLTEQPRLLLYYRTLASLSQKGMSSICPGNIGRIEAGKVDKLDEALILKLVQTVNSILSGVIVAVPAFPEEHFLGIQFAAAGATIQGSWNSAIGVEGEATVRSILIRELRDHIVQIVWKGGQSTDFVPKSLSDVLDRVQIIRTVRLKSGAHVHFGSEPDVSVRNKDEVPMLAIEVKAGSDPAAALERLGAGMKSFDQDRNVNPDVTTVYVVRCMTPELRRRIDQNNPFDYTFGLNDLLHDKKTQKTFANLIHRVLSGKTHR